MWYTLTISQPSVVSLSTPSAGMFLLATIILVFSYVIHDNRSISCRSSALVASDSTQSQAYRHRHIATDT